MSQMHETLVTPAPTALVATFIEFRPNIPMKIVGFGWVTSASKYPLHDPLV
jgi:hypothetical protein